MGNVEWQRSIVLLYQGKAEIIKETEKVIYNTDKSYSYVVPRVIRLIQYVTQIFKNKIPYSKSNVFLRDRFKCQFCGKKLVKNECTVDHVVPKAKGGKSSWINCVTACKRCNGEKGDRDLYDTHFRLLREPVAPSVADFARIKSIQMVDILKDIW